MNRYHSAFGFVLAFTALGVVGGMDYEDAVLQEKQKCEMMKLWDEDTRAGFKVSERRGWPPDDTYRFCFCE